MERFGLPPEVGFRTGLSGLKPGRPTLILIHGAGGSAQSFSSQIRRLDRNLNILALELPGHGQTPGPGMTSIAAYAAWVHQALKRFSFKPFFLGGHSMGGAICLEMGLRYPGSIQGLILMATGAAFKIPPDLLAGLRAEPGRTLGRINHLSYAPGTSPSVIAQSLRIFEQTPVAIIHGDFQACHQFERQDEIRQLKNPALILVGDQDLLTPPFSADGLKDRIPGSRMIILPGAGHMVMLEKHREVNRAIQNFICLKNVSSPLIRSWCGIRS